MKKICMMGVVLVTLGWSESYTQGDRILDMQKMAQAMQDIQSGFFYNNLDIVTAGAKDLKETIVKIAPTQEDLNNTDVYERWMNNNTAMTGRIQKRITKYSNTLTERFQSGDAVQALQVYNRISAECMKCHVSLRKW